MMNPELATLQEWTASLVIDFPEDNIPFFQNEEDWKSLGNKLVQENSFFKNNAPGTLAFNHWKEWAKAVFLSMSNY